MGHYCTKHGIVTGAKVCPQCEYAEAERKAEAAVLALHEKPEGANAQQVGGSHYRDQVVQPWDFIARNGIGYLEGCAIKYLSRWRQKGEKDGVDDLRKARHYIEKLIELETEGKA